MDRAYDIEDLKRLMERLRDPAHGCPWDLKQTYQSIAPFTLEECLELIDALEQSDYEHVEEELGDLLFQVIFYAQLGKEEGRFDFDSVLSGITAKLLRRHPHVFKDGQLEGEEGQRKQGVRALGVVQQRPEAHVVDVEEEAAGERHEHARRLDAMRRTLRRGGRDADARLAALGEECRALL